jgi:drug/metabolite transporter (DMT)-like permease
MNNLRASLLMVAAMAGFAIEDVIIKQISVTLAVPQLLFVLGVLGFMLLAAICQWRGEGILERSFFSRAVLARNLGEMVGSVGFCTALALVPISVASAILQALPLTVTLGAALFLGETVGWRRWAAIVTGMAGVLVILRPFGEGFDAHALWAVMGVAGMTLRDLASRRIRAQISSLRLAAWGFGAVAVAGLVIQPMGPPLRMLTVAESWMMAATAFMGIASYLCMIIAIRAGEVSAIAPLRYVRLVFALLIAVLLLGERPDAPTLIGAGLIVAAGLYALWRERLRALASAPAMR